MKTTDQNRRKAQELAYQAMESYDPEKALSLCLEAVKIDSRCVDALVLMAGTFEDREERVLHLARVVQIAEEDLGGEDFFRENKGYFWGLLETRPYMRARAYLAQTLAEAGWADEAIAHYEAMLDLNPNDNQGLRYALIGLYLEIGDVGGVRRVLDKYEDDGAVFTWSRVLARLLSGDAQGAEIDLSAARSSNPHFESYLLGRKALPSKMPDYYGFGDENEAVVCMDAIGEAWKRHPEAVRWLRGHEVPLQTKAKVGRNDPCPCGSGRKYKKCCLGREDAPSTPTGGRGAAESALYDMHQAMEEREFSSVEEMNAFIQEYNQQRNRKPIDDFEGLSSGQMHRLINFPFESPEIVEFPPVLSVQPSAPITMLFSMLVDAIGEDGLKPTATGNLPRKLVQDVALAYWDEEEYRENTRFGGIRSEDDFHDLNVTRIVAGLAGLIRKYKGRFVLSSKCRKLLREGGMPAAYPVLMRAFIEKFNWGYSDGYPDAGVVQSFFAYTLYLLDRYGDQWRDNTFYEDAFLRAFPAVVDTAEPTGYETKEKEFRGLYSLRCLRRFTEFMGLAEIQSGPDDLLKRHFRLRKLPLLGQAVIFRL